MPSKYSAEIVAVAMLIMGFIAAFAQKHGIAITQNEYAGLLGTTAYLILRLDLILQYLLKKWFPGAYQEPGKDNERK
jgi:hypothetical protein